MAYPLNVEHLFTYHPPKPGQREKFEAITAAALELAKVIADNTPSSPEQTLAIREVQSARMWANAAIALND